jgi:hypothetical protein
MLQSRHANEIFAATSSAAAQRNALQRLLLHYLVRA